MSDKRDAILDVAVGMANEKGVRSLTVRSVAAAADIGPTTLRYYFPSQRDLWDAVLERIFNEGLKDLRIAALDVSPAERLSECLMQFFGTPQHLDVTTNAWFELIVGMLGPSATDASRHAMHVANRVTADRMTRWLTTLADEGVLKADRIDVTVAILFALVEGLLLHAISDPERIARAEIEAAIEATAAAVLRG